MARVHVKPRHINFIEAGARIEGNKGGQPCSIRFYENVCKFVKKKECQLFKNNTDTSKMMYPNIGL